VVKPTCGIAATRLLAVKRPNVKFNSFMLCNRMASRSRDMHSSPAVVVCVQSAPMKRRAKNISLIMGYLENTRLIANEASMCVYIHVNKKYSWVMTATIKLPRTTTNVLCQVLYVIFSLQLPCLRCSRSMQPYSLIKS
jgi:hypothetical protein